MGIMQNPQNVVEAGFWRNFNVSGTSSGVAGPVVLKNVVINGGTLGALVIRDGTNASAGSVLATITGPSGGQVYWYNALCQNGISIFASAATDFTYTFAK